MPTYVVMLKIDLFKLTQTIIVKYPNRGSTRKCFSFSPHLFGKPYPESVKLLSFT